MPQIEVTLDLDSNGILNVSATNKAENMSKEITIVNDKGRLGVDEISNMLQDAEKFRADDEQIRVQYDHQSKLTQCAKNMLATLEKPEYANQISQ